MAAVPYAMFSSPSAVSSATSTTTRTKPVLILYSCSSSYSSVSISPRPKPRRRKNYLRPKLLKTLAKPYSTPILHPQEAPQNPTLPFDSNELETTSDEISGECCSTVAVEDGDRAVVEIEEEMNSVVSVDAEISNASGNSSVLKIVLWVVGIFVFQAVYAVWVLGSVDPDKKDGILEGGNGRKKVKPSLNGNDKIFLGNVGLRQGDVHVDASDLEKKLYQIRAMAKEVREKEGKELKADDDTVSSLDDFEDGEVTAEGEVSRVRSGIEKEVDERLIKLKKRLNSVGEKSLLSYLKKSEKVEDMKQADVVAHVKESNGTKLMFKKKIKFRSHVRGSISNIVLRSKPKGFQKLKDSTHSDTKNINSGKCFSMPLEGNLLEEDPKALQIDCKKLQNERERTGMAKEMGFQNTEPRIGSVQETSHGETSVKGVKSKSSSQVEAQKVNSFTKGKRGDSRVFNNNAGFGSASGLKSKGIRSKPTNKEVIDKQSGIATDLWWLDLPYVLAIYMHRGSDSEEPGGLFTLRIASSTQDHGDSYTIAFEDCVDANNFCYILETFFEDLGDFGVDIIPLSKEG